MEEEPNSFELVENREAIELVPTWEPQLWWLFVGAGVLVLVVLSVVYLRREKVAFNPQNAEREAFRKASEAFRKMEPSGIRESAVRVSLILREYLAQSLGEPALFQTHEEFVSQHDALANLPDGIREATGRFFGELAAIKYGPEDMGDGNSVDFKNRGVELLERIHAA